MADPGFLHRVDQVHLMPGAARLVALANARRVPTIVVTNQSGIARGLFGWDDFHAVNRRMAELLAARGARIDALLACAWHPDGCERLLAAEHPWRKPRPGMLRAAQARFGVDLSGSWLAGDRLSDVLAAKAASLAGAALVSDTPREPVAGDFPVLTSASLVELVPGLIDRIAGTSWHRRPACDAQGIARAS